MLRLPAEFALRLCAAQLLIHRVASRPIAELGGGRFRRNHLRFLMPRTERDAADGKSFNRAPM